MSPKGRRTGSCPARARAPSIVPMSEPTHVKADYPQTITVPNESNIGAAIMTAVDAVMKEIGVTWGPTETVRGFPDEYELRAPYGCIARFGNGSYYRFSGWVVD